MTAVTKFPVHANPAAPKVPEPPIANAAIGTEIATINAVLAVLRKFGLIEP